MASRKKTASKTAVAPTEAPKPTAASKAKDAEAQPQVVRVDLGESLPTPPIKTATDND